MSMKKLRLDFVSISHVNGKSFYPCNEHVDGFKAKFGFKIDTSNFNQESDYELNAFMSVEASLPGSNEPFFSIEIIGKYSCTAHEGIKEWVDSTEGAYTIASNTFPYLRNIAKPLLEHLGAADVDFPWNPPENFIKVLESTEKNTPPQRKPRKNTEKKQS